MPRTRPAGTPGATELESCVLAIIEQVGPCTRYAVRKYLAESLSSYWSGSAGAIYPILQRFTVREWVEVVEEPFGSRRKRIFKLTSLGREQLRSWLSAPVPLEAVAHTFDPLRARVFFLDMVERKEQLAFLDDSIAKTVEMIERHREEREDLRPSLSTWELHGREGALRELAARVEWLREVREGLAKEPA